MNDQPSDSGPERSQTLRHLLVWVVIAVFLIVFWVAVGTVVAAWLD
jgi:hypothetical protein